MLLSRSCVPARYLTSTSGAGNSWCPGKTVSVALPVHSVNGTESNPETAEIYAQCRGLSLPLCFNPSASVLVYSAREEDNPYENRGFDHFARFDSVHDAACG